MKWFKMPGRGDGNGYIAQAKELEQARRNLQAVGLDLVEANRTVDMLKQQLNASSAHVGEMIALATHQVRTAFVIGLGAGVVVAMAVWGVIALLR